MSKKVLFRTPYTDRPDPVLECTKPSLTQQSYRSECDINCIVDAYGIDDVRCGCDFSINPYAEEFDATILSKDPIKVHSTINKARAEFEKLPNSIKYMCNNDMFKLEDVLNSEQGRAIISQMQHKPQNIPEIQEIKS